jgi:FkbM family methyltransferase
MGLISSVRGLVPQSLKNTLRGRTLPWRASRLLSPYLPEALCVDVGAAHYPHVKWLMFLNAPRVQWLAVEPNELNLAYTRSWSWPCRLSINTTGLSREGGLQTLHITHVDTGSSLLPPEITPSMQHRVADSGYFFPVTPREINTITLPDAISATHAQGPVLVKLDTQGTELAILQGAQSLFDARRIVGIEMEATLLAEPIMKGSGKFWEACRYLEAQGFELLAMKPIMAPRSPGSHPATITYLNECDAVFALRRDVAAKLDVEYRIALLAFYLTYLLFDEALSLLRADEAMSASLRQHGCDTAALHQLLTTATQ